MQLDIFFHLECTSSLSFETFTSSDTIVCSIPTECNGARCCMDIPQLETSLEFKMIIDTCGNRLRLKVDKLEFDIPLHDFDYGSSDALSIYGFATLR